MQCLVMLFVDRSLGVLSLFSRVRSCKDLHITSKWQNYTEEQQQYWINLYFFCQKANADERKTSSNVTSSEICIKQATYTSVWNIEVIPGRFSYKDYKIKQTAMIGSWWLSSFVLTFPVLLSWGSVLMHPQDMVRNHTVMLGVHL